jgi:Ni/Fe-hydrogenase subunit HybB-like protein
MLKVDPIDKAKLIDPLFKKPGPLFWGAFLLLSAGLAWGMSMYIRQLVYGLGETGMQRPTYWGMYMVNFIFFIGISHAGTLISAILRVTGAEWRRPITRVAEAITAFALIVGSLQIIIDMGRPDRLLYVILHGRLQSPILWDVVSVTVYFLGSVAYLYLPLIPDAALLRDTFPENGPGWRRKLYTLLAIGWRGNRSQWIRLEKAISIMAIFIIPVAISVHTIISWILATTVQPGWHSTIFGPYFVVGAIFSGIGALFLAMTGVRAVLGLESYISQRQYRNLGLLFITMNLVWFYFTFAEHLGIAAGQQSEEFPILASKLWGQYSTGFWSMVGLMFLALWVLIVPRVIPSLPQRALITRPRFALASSGSAGVLLLALYAGPQLNGLVSVEVPDLRWAVGLVAGGLLLAALLSLTFLLKGRPVLATVISACAVVAAMWLERWYIIVPTMTLPRLIPYAIYRPTLTEISLTVGSLSLFGLMFLIFFKFFPAVSIWEVAEGRVIEEARSKTTIPSPEPVQKPARRWGFKKTSERR